MRIGLLFSFLFLLLPVAAQTKHPFTFEDMMKLKRVEEPLVSPDGKWVLFAAVDVDLQANTKTPHVWVVALTSRATNTRVAHPGPVLARVGYSDTKKAGSSTSSNHSRANDPGMTGGESGTDSRGREREIISDQDADRPRWSPDGKHFAFVSTKENGSQVWIADFDDATGTVTGKHRLTNIATEADGELWSPDGKNILFKSDVWPECDGAPYAETDCNAKKLTEERQSKVKALIFMHLLFRHWNAYKEGKRTHLFLIDAKSMPEFRKGQGNIGMYETFRDLTPGDYDAPVFSLGGQDDYAFSPDGQEICYASNHDPEPAISTNNDLFTVPVNFPGDASSAQVLAATKDIIAENKAADNTPLYSPDGKYIAYRAQQRPGYESDRWRLILYDRTTGEKKNLTEDFDRWVDGFAWAPTSNTIYFDAEDSGTAPVWSLDLIGQYATVPKQLFRSGTNGDIAITSDGKTLIFSRNTIQAPNGIFTAKISELPEKSAVCGEKATDFFVACPEKVAVPLTHLNDSALNGVSMSELDPFGFIGAAHETVEGFLVKPPSFDPNKKYPVKFIVHGGPEVPMGDEWTYRWNAELFAANGYVVIEINFHGSPGYGQKFIDAINGDWGGAPYEDLMKGLDYAEQH